MKTITTLISAALLTAISACTEEPAPASGGPETPATQPAPAATQILVSLELPGMD